MAAKKKGKAKKKAPAKKAKTKKAVKKTKTAAKKAVKKAAKKSKKAPAKKKTGLLARVIKAAKKAVAPAKPKKKKKIVGEGDYAASAKFDADQAGFVKKNKARIPELGKAAEAALDGPEGDSLRAAEATAAGRSRDTFDA